MFIWVGQLGFGVVCTPCLKATREEEMHNMATITNFPWKIFHNFLKNGAFKLEKFLNFPSKNFPWEIFSRNPAPGSVAHRAQVQEGFVLLSVDGQEPADVNALSGKVARNSGKMANFVRPSLDIPYPGAMPPLQRSLPSRPLTAIHSALRRFCSPQHSQISPVQNVA